MLGNYEPASLRPGIVDRRQFLKVVSLGAAGFAVGCGRSDDPTADADTAAAASETIRTTDLNAFVRIGSDDTVTVVVKHLDKGQGVTTGLPAIVAEELGAAWSQMRAEFAPADPTRYNNLFFGPAQGTGGSTSVANSWQQLRTAAAAARDMLKAAAAERLGVAADTLSVDGGRIRAPNGGGEVSFGDVAAAAGQLAAPESPPLKDPASFTLIGTDLPRLDSSAKTDGTAMFTIDVSRPNQVIAVVARPPRFGATVARLDASAALTVDGVSDVVEIDRGVAVLASSYPAALRGRDALDIDWDETRAERRGTAELLRDFRGLLEQPGASARDDGDVDEALSAAATTVDAEFTFPYLAHASMEPLDCVVELGESRCDIWTASQLPTVDQAIAANLTGLTPSDIVIHTQFAGGSFGRRAVPDSDFVAEAVMIAKAIDGRRPVKLQWSREDDMRGGRYRPMSVHRLEAGLDADGNLTAWNHRVVTQSVMRGTPFEGSVQDGIDPTSVEGARGLPYAVANCRVDAHLADAGVPVLWWRSVGHTHNAYVTEVFFDAVAAAAGADPVALRRRLLQDHPRHLAVLELAAEKSGWAEPLPAGRGRGVAVHESFNSFVAQVAEVTLGEDGSVSVDRVVCAVDCGIAVTPDVIRAQMEGAIGYGLSAFLREGITLTDGRVDQANFDSYRPLRIDEMPTIEVHIVPSSENPTGVGEPGTPPIAPAVANAIVAAGGPRIVTLPLADQLSG